MRLTVREEFWSLPGQRPGMLTMRPRARMGMVNRLPFIKITREQGVIDDVYTAAPANFYTIFCIIVLFSYICQHVKPGTASLVRGEKGRALLIAGIDYFQYESPLLAWIYVAPGVFLPQIVVSHYLL